MISSSLSSTVVVASFTAGSMEGWITWQEEKVKGGITQNQ
jgi:hypothetical protein